MRRILKRRGGFTLIELMIVVAIIGILAAIAIPNFMQFQMRATSSEGKTNLAAIRTAEEGYFAEFRTYVAAAAAGNTANGTTKVAWSPAATNGFNTIGWAPEGDVYFQYQVTAGMANTTTGFDEFAAGAQANLDGADNNGDGIATQQWAYLKPVAGNTATAMAPPYGGGGCAAAGVWDPVAMSTNLLRTVGPCDMSSGQSEF